MTRVAVTGAAGDVGREALAALDEHEVRALTHREHDDVDSELLELTDAATVRERLAGVDVVVHLAGNPDAGADWEAVRGPNVEGTYNVYEAAREHGIERVVFASSNHAVQMYEATDPERPWTVDDPDPIPADDPPRPDGPYGVSKVCGEAFGSYYADRYGIEVVNLRIGWLRTLEQLEDTQDDPGSAMARFSRAVWLSPRDCRHLVARSVAADLPENPLTVYGISENAERYFPLTPATCGLGYRPRDDSSEALDVDASADDVS
jgi:L-arabinose 1-dehydrogenase [NAD(P)+]